MPPNVEPDRPVCAKSGHSPDTRRIGNFDPKRKFPLGSRIALFRAKADRHDVNSARSVFASIKSAVSKPSVNQSKIGASRSWAAVRRPCAHQSRARLVGAANASPARGLRDRMRNDAIRRRLIVTGKRRGCRRPDRSGLFIRVEAAQTALVAVRGRARCRCIGIAGRRRPSKSAADHLEGCCGA